MRLLVTRPAAESEALAVLLAARGHAVTVAPVMEIRPIPGAQVSLESVQALLVTSRNGAEALARATADRRCPVLAVGRASAAACRAAGFADVRSADGDVEALARLVTQRLRPEAGALLHVAGSAVAGDLAGTLSQAGYKVRRAVLYEARPVELLPEAAAAFLKAHAPGGVLFYSPRSTALFGRLCGAAELSAELKLLTALCLSPAVAEAARALGFGGVRIAAGPDQDALLALIPLEPDTSPS